MTFTREGDKMRVEYSPLDFAVDKSSYLTNIETDDDGHELFTIQDPYDEFNRYRIRRKMFMYKPGNAIRAIRDGYGDAFMTSQRAEQVIRFVDREYGESVRQSTLKGFGGTDIKPALLKATNLGRLVYNKSKKEFEYIDQNTMRQRGCWFDTMDEMQAFLRDELQRVLDLIEKNKGNSSYDWLREVMWSSSAIYVYNGDSNDEILAEIDKNIILGQIVLL